MLLLISPFCPRTLALHCFMTMVPGLKTSNPSNDFAKTYDHPLGYTRPWHGILAFSHGMNHNDTNVKKLHFIIFYVCYFWPVFKKSKHLFKKRTQSANKRSRVRMELTVTGERRILQTLSCRTMLPEPLTWSSKKTVKRVKCAETGVGVGCEATNDILLP